MRQESIQHNDLSVDSPSDCLLSTLGTKIGSPCWNILEVILKRDVKVEGMAPIQESQAQEGMSTLVFNPNYKVTTRVRHWLDTAFVFFIGATSKEIP